VKGDSALSQHFRQATYRACSINFRFVPHSSPSGPFRGTNVQRIKAPLLSQRGIFSLSISRRMKARAVVTTFVMVISGSLDFSFSRGMVYLNAIVHYMLLYLVISSPRSAVRLFWHPLSFISPPILPKSFLSILLRTLMQTNFAIFFRFNQFRALSAKHGGGDLTDSALSKRRPSPYWKVVKVVRQLLPCFLYLAAETLARRGPSSLERESIAFPERPLSRVATRYQLPLIAQSFTPYHPQLVHVPTRSGLCIRSETCAS
jgi:hypothetical protein